jgi:hypothetical protein
LTLSDFVARYGALLGCGLITVGLLWVGFIVATAVEALKYSFTQVSDSITRVFGDLNEHLQELNERIDSLHRLFGGRQWQNDELEKDLNGPTIQKLLQSINRRLKRLAPGDQTNGQTNLIVSTEISDRH